MSVWTYMDIKDPGHSLTLVQGHSDSTFSNLFSLETARLIEANFHVGPPWDRGMKICSNGPGHMTKMATMPIYGKKNFFSGTNRPMTFKVGMQRRVLKYYQICSNYDPVLTLTYFTARSNWSQMLLYGKKVKQWIFQKLL